MKVTSIVWLSCLAAVLGVAFLGAPAFAQTIKIGHQVALTGPNATWASRRPTP